MHRRHSDPIKTSLPIITFSLDFRNAAIHAKLHTGCRLRHVVALLGKVTKSEDSLHSLAFGMGQQ
jgi:hypothetical protein